MIRHQYLNIPYAEQSPAQTLDLHLPKDLSSPAPLLVVIHGGAFARGDKADHQVRPFLTARQHGYAVASLNYRLSGEAGFPAGIMDCKAAIRFLKANAAQLGIDPFRVAVAGGSSGANYALMLAATPHVAELEDKTQGNPDYSTAVQCAVSWFAPTDFLQMDDMLRENGMNAHAVHDRADFAESVYLGGQITVLDPDLVERADPAQYITPELPPILLQHGRADTTVPWQQSAYFADRAAEVCGPERVVLDILEDAGHDDPAFGALENMARVMFFLDTHLKG